MPYSVVEIIEIPDLGRQAAVRVCKEMGIKSQQDKAKLAQAKDKVYLRGFYKGVMLVGSQAGKKTCDAKPIVRQELIDAGHAAVYWEPEEEVARRPNPPILPLLCAAHMVA